MRVDKIKTENLGNLLVGVPIVDKVRWNLGQLLISGLWTFGLPCKIPGLETLD